MAASGAILARCLQLVRSKARPGVTTGDLDEAAERFIRSQGGEPAFKGYRGFPGSLYLAAIAALPTILINQTSANFFFGGTSILIVVGVALDTMKQLEAQLMMRNYEGFLK